MSSTSLARQLEQLRTSSSKSTKPGISSLASSGPSILDLKNEQELSLEQLEILAKEAFKQIAGSINVLEKFKCLVFQDERKNDDDVDMEDEVKITLENLLVILSPYLRQRFAQFLLQYLLNKYKIHETYTELFLFISLQHYEFTIFGRIVESLPMLRSSEESRPRWVEHFRSACHPATTIGMHRHLACDKGFFSLLCEKFTYIANNHVTAFGKEENVSYNGIVSYFVKAMVGALNLLGSISEQQTHLLMQVIVNALKCENKEFRAAGSILFSILVTRVRLNKKAAGKLLKVLAKLVDNHGCNIESLGMTAILYRCQSVSDESTIEKTKVLDLILKHNAVITKCTTQINQMDEEDKEFARRLFKTLAILSKDIFSSGKPTEAKACLIQLIAQILISSSTWSNELLPTSDVAEILIETASSSLIECKSSKKKLKKPENLDYEIEAMEVMLGKISLASKCILEYFREKFQDEYCRKFKPDAKNSDILFMDQGNLEGVDFNDSSIDYAALMKGPTPEEIAAKRILLDNSFIQEISAEYINFNLKLRDRKFKDLLNENANAVKTLFGKTKPSFLLQQLPASKLACLIVNCIKVYERKPKTLSKILNFALSDEIVSNEKILTELKASKVSLDLIYLQQLFVINFDTKDAIFEAIEKYSKISNNEIFAHIIVTLRVIKDQVSNTKDFVEKIVHKMITLLSPPLVSKLLDDVIDGNKGHQEADVINVILLLTAALFGKSKLEVKEIEIKLHCELINKMATLGLLAYQELDICSLDSWSKPEGRLFDAKPVSKLISHARDNKLLPLQTFEVLFSSVRQWIKSKAMDHLKPEIRTPLRARILALALIYDQKCSKQEENGHMFQELVDNNLFYNTNDFENFVAEQLFLPQEQIDVIIWEKLLPREKAKDTKVKKQLSFKIKEKCTDHLCHKLNTCQDNGSTLNHFKTLLDFKNPTIPMFLASLSAGNNHEKIIKLIFKFFETIVNQYTAATDSIDYYPLLKHLANSKATIIAGHDSEDNAEVRSNIKNVMQIFFRQEEKSKAITKGILDFICESKLHQVFEPLVTFLSDIPEEEILEDISGYGISLLSNYKKDPISISKGIEVILLHFLPNILQLHENESCWDFLSACLEENRINLIYKNEIKSVAEFTLEIIMIVIPEIRYESDSEENSLLKKMFSFLIDLSKDKNVESQTLMAARNCIDAVILKMSKSCTSGTYTPSQMFAEKLNSLWGDQFIESGASSGRLTKQGGRERSARFTSLYGKTYVRSLSNKNEEEQKWKQTLFLLENFLNYTKTLDQTDLISADFNGLEEIQRPLNVLLKISLDMDELYDNSYTLDILLSAIHVVVDISSKIDKKSSDTTNPELIVQCIRTCKTPGTKATALLILAKQASSASSAEYVMHNSIPIFTFMGNHFLKIEAKSSFDVACQAIDIIIPHIQRACLEKEKENKGKQSLLQKTSLSIINTFVDASSDMPPHRFKTFMSQLVRNLSSSAFGISDSANVGENENNFTDNYLWIVTLLLLKTDSKRLVYTGKGNETESVKLTAEEKHHQLRELYSAFDSYMTFQMEALLKMLTEMKHDTPEIRTLLGIKVESEAMEVDGEVTKLPDSTKQFEMIRIKMMLFVSSGLLQSKHFVNKIIETLEVDFKMEKGLESESQVLQRQLCSLIEISILNMENFAQMATRKHKGNKTTKISHQLSICCERVLEAALNILPNFSFVQLLHSLLSNTHAIVRKKSLEVFISKLQVSSVKSKDKQSIMQVDNINELLGKLVTIAKGKVPVSSSELNNTELEKETHSNQQMALMCIRSFAKASLLLDSSKYLNDLKNVCKELSNKVLLKETLGKEGDESVVAALLLCLTDTFSSIGPHAVGMLPSFIEWLLEIMSGMSLKPKLSLKDDNVTKIRIDSSVVLSGLILSIQKCMENFGGFLNPFYGRFVTASCKLTSIHHEGMVTEQENKKPKMRNSDRIQHLHLSMSKGVPTHSLIDIASKCHDDLSKESPQCIMALANIMKDNVTQLDKNGALSVSKPFLDYFLNAFNYRQSLRLVEMDRRMKNPSNTDIELVEDKLIEAFLALALKLPLDDFKPMFYRLVNFSTVGLSKHISNELNIAYDFYL